MKDVMIDLETFATSSNAAIVQFGGVYFDRATGETGQTLKLNIDIETSGREIDANTIFWWLKQSNEARESILQDPRIAHSEAMQKIFTFLFPAVCVWSHATFDYPILSDAMTENGAKWDYRKARDIRTLMDIAGVDPKDFQAVRAGTHHDALADAIHQVSYCMVALSKLDWAFGTAHASKTLESPK